MSLPITTWAMFVVVEQYDRSLRLECHRQTITSAAPTLMWGLLCVCIFKQHLDAILSLEGIVCYSIGMLAGGPLRSQQVVHERGTREHMDRPDGDASRVRTSPFQISRRRNGCEQGLHGPALGNCASPLGPLWTAKAHPACARAIRGRTKWM